MSGKNLIDNTSKPAVRLEMHFTELRHRLLKSLISILIAFLLCWFFSAEILDFFRRPIQPFLKNTAGGLIFTAPMDQFLAHIKISVFTAVCLSCPYWLLQFWFFISPGLYRFERKLFLFFWMLGTVLFLLGMSFAYFIVFPVIFQVLLFFGNGVDQAMITINNYLSFLMQMTMVFGLVFEMPLVLLFLNRIDVLSIDVLKKYRKHAVLILAVVSAFISPPDVLSMFLLLLPLIGLYELSIFLLSFFKRFSILDSKKTDSA